MAPNGNRIVVYKGPGQVAVETVDYPKLEVPQDVASAMGMSRKAPHAVILKCVSTNICGSDQHMVRGRTTAPVGQTVVHPGFRPLASRSLQSSHLVTLGLKPTHWKRGMWYGQVIVQ